MKVVRIGTRASALARAQASDVASRLSALTPDVGIEIVDIVATGDELQDVPLTDVEGTGFFTATLERALLEDVVDVAVHSYKDLPVESTDGLSVAAVPSRGPVEDVLSARDGLTLGALPAGARIGTCSARRTAQVQAMRPDLDVRPLRGNVPTRIERVTRGELDAVVLARAGLVRLGLDEHITEVFALDVLWPAPAQGALAVQCRTADVDLRRQLAGLDDDSTRRAVTAERALLHALGGGCSVPVGANAHVGGASITLSAGVFSLGSPRKATVVDRGVDPQTLGEAAARHLLRLGAGAILDDFSRAPRLGPLVEGSAS